MNSARLLEPSALIRTAKLIAVPLPFILAGYSLSFSQNAVPAIYDTPAQHSTPAFKKIFYDGATVIVPCQILSAIACGYLASSLPHQRIAWITAAVANMAPLPWTVLVMQKGIQRLIAISESKEMQEKATANLEHRQLLVRWVKQNVFRMASYVLAGVVALNATS